MEDISFGIKLSKEGCWKDIVYKMKERWKCFVYEKENLFSEFPILCAFQGLLENIFSQADRAFIQKPDHDIVAMVYYFLKKNKRRFEKTKSEVLRKVSRYFPYSDAINESMVKWIEKL